MLYTHYNKLDNTCDFVNDDFDDLFDVNWLFDELNIEIIKTVDKSMFVDGYMHSMETGASFPVNGLSTGTKALILLHMLSDITEISSLKFGDNCTPFLLRITQNKDVHIVMEHHLKFPNEGFVAYSTKLGRLYRDYDEYLSEVFYEVE